MNPKIKLQASTTPLIKNEPVSRKHVNLVIRPCKSGNAYIPEPETRSNTRN